MARIEVFFVSERARPNKNEFILKVNIDCMYPADCFANRIVHRLHTRTDLEGIVAEIESARDMDDLQYRFIIN